MQTFGIKLFIDNIEQTLEVRRETHSGGSYVVNENQRFVARIFKDEKGRWKTREVSDLSPSVIQAIGEEIDQQTEQS